MPSDLISELEAALKAATPGEWFAVENKAGERVYSVEIRGDGRCRDLTPWREGLKRWSSRIVAVIQDWATWTDHPANRDFIILAHNHMPAMLAVAKAAREYREAVRALEATYESKAEVDAALVASGTAWRNLLAALDAAGERE